jgi:ATP-dependent exoDNAse (exonuclease V) beta subunit
MKPPQLVSAGAGAGKTYWIVETIVARVRAGVPLERIAAVTFTEAAAAELQDRVRARLLAAGERSAATRVDSAAICTIHRFALALLQRYPLAAGLPPEPIVLEEVQSSRLLHEHIASLLSATRGESVAAMRTLLDEGLGAGLGLSERGFLDGDTPTGRLQHLVRQLIEKARSLGMDAARLREEADLAATRLSEALGPVGDGARLQGVFERVLADALAFLEECPEPPTKKDEKLYALLRPITEGAGGTWFDTALRFARLDEDAHSKQFKPGDALAAAASAVACDHPEARARLLRCVRGVVLAAAQVLSTFEAEKRRIGALDFEDMQVIALELLTGRGPAEKAYAPLIAQAFRLVVVDEFQDTSPLQFRLFEVLRAHGTEVVYVGDLKQAIYAFRTADSALFAALLEQAEQSQRPIERLSASRRSRPELVAFTNDLFGVAMGAAGLRFESLSAENAYSAGKCPKALPSVDVLIHPPGTQRGMKGAKEYGVITRLRGLIEGGGLTVLDRASGVPRPARWGDVAVLGRKGAQLKQWAVALRACGIPCVLEEGALFETLEVRLARAWLRMLASPRDSAAAAAVLLSELYGISQRAMVQMTLAGVVGSPARALELSTRDPSALTLTPFEQRALQRCAGELSECRRALRHLPLAEAVEAVLERVDLGLRLALRADAARAAQIRANLRRVSEIAYELSARTERPLDLHGATGITLENLLVELDRAAAAGYVQRAGDEQAEAVRLVTIHSSKGLEYPLVVLDALDESLSIRLPRIEVDRPTDPQVLLGDDALDRSGVRLVPEVGFKALADRLRGVFDAERGERAEWLRLLYVAITRAREHLVLLWPEEPKRSSATSSRQAKQLLAEAAARLPRTAGEVAWTVRSGGDEHRVTILNAVAPPEGWLDGSASGGDEAAMEALRAVVEQHVSVAATPAPTEPAELEEERPQLGVVAPTELCRVADCPEVPRLAVLYPREHGLARHAGEPAELVEIPSARAERLALDEKLEPAALGTLLHEAIERIELTGESDVLAPVQSLLARRGVSDDAVRAFVMRAVESVRAALVHLGAREIVGREVPFAIEVEGVLVRGAIDLVVQSEAGLHVIDLKSHLVDEASVGRWVGYYRPQLDAYAVALSRLARAPIAGRHLLLPSAGMLATVREPFEPEAASARMGALAALLAAETPGPGPENDCGRCAWQSLCRVGRRERAAAEG